MIKPPRKEYSRLLMGERVREIKLKCLKYKGGKCEICEYDKCPGALEFHHKNPKEKDFSISSKASVNFEKLKSELDKCILVCSNCHSEIHWVEKTKIIENRRKIIGPIPKRKFGKELINCDNCNLQFSKFKSKIRTNNFCSLDCKKIFYGGEWPKDKELKQMFKTKSIKQISNELGKTYNSVKKKKQTLKSKI